MIWENEKKEKEKKDQVFKCPTQNQHVNDIPFPLPFPSLQHGSLVWWYTMLKCYDMSLVWSCLSCSNIPFCISQESNNERNTIVRISSTTKIIVCAYHIAMYLCVHKSLQKRENSHHRFTQFKWNKVVPWACLLWCLPCVFLIFAALSCVFVVWTKNNVMQRHKRYSLFRLT